LTPNGIFFPETILKFGLGVFYFMRDKGILPSFFSSVELYSLKNILPELLCFSKKRKVRFSFFRSFFRHYIR